MKEPAYRCGGKPGFGVLGQTGTGLGAGAWEALLKCSALPVVPSLAMEWPGRERAIQSPSSCSQTGCRLWTGGSLCCTIQLQPPPSRSTSSCPATKPDGAPAAQDPQEYDLVWPSQPPPAWAALAHFPSAAGPLRSPCPQLQGSSVRADTGRRHCFPRSPPNSPFHPLGPLTGLSWNGGLLVSFPNLRTSEEAE